MCRYIEERKTPVAEVLEEGVNSEASPLSWLRGQIWVEVVQPRIIEELEVFWKSEAKQGYSLEEVAR